MSITSSCRAALAAAVATLTLAPSATAAEPDWRDLVYAEVDGGQLRLDLYRPREGDGPFPLLISIHGGGWLAGDKHPLPDQVLPLLEQGFAVASIQYRLTNQGWKFDGPLTFPAQIHDCKAAVRWLRAHAATYDLDPQRFGAWGLSAGGHLAALLGTSPGVAELEGEVGGHLEQSSAVQAIVDYFGPTDILNMNPDRTWPPGGISHDVPSSPESKLIGWTGPGQGIGDIRANADSSEAPYPQLVERCRQANPISHVTAAAATAFIVHGALDTMVPVAQSRKLADALVAAGVPVDVRVIEDAGHGPFDAAVDVAAVGFLVRALGSGPADEDVTGDGAVDLADLIAVILAWGWCPPGPAPCPADVNRSGQVDVDDLMAVIMAWRG